MKLRRVLRWVGFALAGLVGLVIVARIALPFVLPGLLARVLRPSGLACTYDRLQLSMLRGRIALWGLDVRPLDAAAAAPRARVQFLEADVSVGRLLTGPPLIRRVELDGVDLWVDQEAPLGPLAAGPAAPPPAEPAPPDRPSSILDLELPVEVEALRVQHVGLHVRDRRRSPEFSTLAQALVRVSDLGSPARPTRVEVSAWSQGGLDVLRLEAEGRIGGRRLEARVRLNAVGLRPHALGTLLETIGLRAAANEIDFALEAEARAEPIAGSDDARATARVHDLVVRADGSEAAAVEELTVEADAIGRSGAAGTVRARGVRGRVELLEDGAVRLPGLDLLLSPASPASPAPAAAPPPAPARGAPWTWTAREVRLTDARLAFRDAGVEPPAELAAEVEEITVEGLGSATPDRDARIAARLRAPGIAEALRLDGTVRPFAPRFACDVRLQAGALRPDALAPYLRGAGLAPALESGELALRFQTSAEGTAVSELSLRDGARDLVAIGRAAVDAEAGFGAQAGVKSLELENARVALAGDPQGSVHFAGLRTIPGEGPPPPPPWALTLVAGASIQDLVIGAAAPAPAQVSIRCGVEGQGEVRVEGSLASRGALPDLDAKLQVHGQGLSLALLEPRFRAWGFESLIDAGSLEAGIDATVRRRDGRLEAAATLSRLALRNGPDELLALERLSAEWRGADDGGGRATVALEKPVLRAARDVEGGLHFLGFRLPPPRPSAPAPGPASAPGSVPPAAEDPAANGPPSAEPAPLVLLERLQLADVTLRWSDAAVTPPVEVEATIEGEGSDLPLGAGPATGQFAVRLAVRDALDQLSLSGSLRRAPGKTALALDLQGDGLRSGPLQAYFPPGLAAELRSGRLRARIEAELSGTTAHASVSGLELRDGGEEPLVRIGALTARASHPTPASLTVEELTLTGVEVAAHRSGRGLHALGLVFGSAPPTSAGPPVPAAPEPGAVPAPPPPTALHDVLDSLRVERLNVGVDRLRFTDESRPGAAPLEVALHLQNLEPMQVLSEHADDLPGLRLRLTGAAKPVVGSIDVGLRLAPTGGDPGMDATIALDGIRGEGLVEAFPALRERLDASGLQDGRLEARVRAVLHARRRGRFGFDFSEGFGLEAGLTGLALRAAPGGPVVAGLESVRVDVARVDDREVRVREIEIVKPSGELLSRPEGTLFAGLLWKPAAAPAAAAPPPAPAPAAAAPGNRREVRIDVLTVEGIDFRYLDQAVSPPLVVPIEDLDLVVRRFTTRTDPEPVPLDFQLALRAGAVELPSRESGSMIGGLLAAVTGGGPKKPAGPERAPLFQEVVARGRFALQPVLQGWATILAEGLELTGFRGLTDRAGVTLRGGVATTKIELYADGRSLTVKSLTTLDDLSLSEPVGGPLSRVLKLPASLDTVLFVLDRGRGQHRLPLTFTLEGNQMSLAGATEVLIVTLGKLIAEAIARSPLRITDTVTGTLGGLVGFALPQTAAAVEPSRAPIAVGFPPGDLALTSEERARVVIAAERLRREPELAVTVRHVLRRADVELVAARANPDPAASAELRVRLLRERDELERRRAAAAGAVRAALALSDRTGAEEGAARLRDVDAQRAKVETGIDRITELLVPGTPRRRAARTRVGLRLLGEERLAAVRAALVEAGIAEDRINERRPSSRPAEGDGGGEVVLTPRRNR